ncbi:MAG: hypothetical protein COB02_02880 [Candidatus Cloacimonadota bacterium]|nr:MAG: hypothetical protein COB02_02880 [Candidatus Cloacimonadota bacterium]
MRRLLGTLAVSATILSASHAANPFADVSSNHWAYGAINTVVNSGVMKGYNNGMFKGGEKVSRYQMAVIISRLHDKFAANGTNVSPDVMQAMDRLGEEFMDELDLIGARLTELENAFHEHVSTGEGSSMSTDGFKFSGDVRVRSEVRDQDLVAAVGNKDSDTRHLVRTTLNIDKSVDKADFHVQLQHYTTMGNRGGTATGINNAGSLDLHEAYVNLHIGDSSSLTIGRMEVGIGNESLVGKLHWSNTPRSFDGFVFSSSTDQFDYKLWTLNVNETSTGAINVAPAATGLDTQLHGADAWWKDVFDGKLHVQYYTQVDARAAGDRLDTYGFDWTRTTDSWDFYVQYAKQGGNDALTSTVAVPADHDGDMLNLKAMYDFDNGHKAGLEYTSYSGNDAGAGASVDNGAWQGLYPTSHKFIGAADLFRMTNVEDITIHWTKKANDKNTFGVAYHILSLENAQTGPTLWNLASNGVALANAAGNFEDDLGTEIDLTWSHNYSKNVDFHVGYSIFSAGDYFTANQVAGTPGATAPDANFAWLTTSVKF